MQLESYKYFVISFHREENIDNNENLEKIEKILHTLSEKFEMPIIFSTHPRTRKRLNTNEFSNLVKFINPVSFSDYIKLQINSNIVLSDSGTINEESSILNFPAINVRETYERPEAMEEGSVVLSGLSCERILQTIELIKFQERGEKRDLKIVKDYDLDNVSEKIIRIILSYTDYVNKFIWKK